MEQSSGTPPAVRITGVRGFTPSTDGRAFLLVVETPTGPMTLEVPEAALRELIKGLTQASVACALRRSDLPAVPDTDPATSVYLPASDINSLNVAGAHRRLVFRVGIIDLAVMVPTRQMAMSLAAALVED